MSGMQRKTIRKVLREKIEDLLKSVDDPKIKDLISENIIITGGSITSMLLGEKINDYDVYFRTFDSTMKIAEHYVNQFNKLNNPSIEPYVTTGTFYNIKGEYENRVCIYVKSSGAAGEGDDSNYQYYEMTDNIHGDQADQYLNEMLAGKHGDKNPDEDGEELPKYRPVFMSQNAITLKNKVQLIIRFYGEPKEIHNNYDFVHAMCSYDYHNDILDMPGEALESIMSKTLTYRGSLYPICSLFRVRKFIERGWKIKAGEILKMAWQISEIDLKDQGVLREQLVGCDAAYMYQLIRLMDAHKEENKDLEIDSAYVVSLIDKVFNE